MKFRHFNQLDGVRGIAALSVMFCHVITFFPGHLLYSYASLFGQAGVSLFFSLSGFLITGILLNARKEEHFAVKFFARRTLRIFPLYFGFLALFYFVLPFHPGYYPASFQEQWPYWFYLQDFAITFQWNSKGPEMFWSLAIEEHYYLVWPFMIYFSNERWQKLWIALLLAGTLLCRVAMISDYEVYYFTFTRLDELLLGSMVALVFKNQKNANVRAYLTIFVASLLLTAVLWMASGVQGNTYVQVLKYTTIGLMFSSIIGYLVSTPGTTLVNRLFGSKPLRYIGKISYGLYVFHTTCFFFVDYYIGHEQFGVFVVTTFAFTTIVASASYYLWERPFLKMKRFFDYGIHPGGFSNPGKIYIRKQGE